MKKVLMCDPPSGWKYDFPKPIPEEHRERVKEWLVENGYPKILIDSFGDRFYCKFWELEIE